MKPKKIIMALIICVVCILIVLICILFTNRDQNGVNNTIGGASEEDTSNFVGDSYVYEAQKVTDANIFYSVSYCIEKYYTNLYIDYETYDEEMINDIKDNLINTLSESYKNEKNITEDNILNEIGILDAQVQFTTTNMNSIVGEEFSNYAIEGMLTNPDTKEYIGKRYFNVIVNNTNNTYAITPIEETENFDITQIDLSIDALNLIDKNDDNQFIITTMNYSNLLKNYMTYFRNMAMNYPDIAYELIDTDYRSSKFENIEDFYEYINVHREELENITLDKYQITNLDDYVQYVVIDTNGKYYIFKEDGIMNFKILLDTYTVDLDEFLEQYNGANDQTKTGMNIEKIINAINDKDYRYVYNKLDNTFKTNNFATLEEFQNFVQTQFFDKNELEYIDYAESGNLCIYTLSLKNKNNEEENPKNLTIIMQIQEGTNFKMSFSIE